MGGMTASVTISGEISVIQWDTAEVQAQEQGDLGSEGLNIVDAEENGPNLSGLCWPNGSAPTGWQDISTIGTPEAAAKCIGPLSLPT